LGILKPSMADATVLTEVEADAAAAAADAGRPVKEEKKKGWRRAKAKVKAMGTEKLGPVSLQL